MSEGPAGPLVGIRVLELGHLVAGPLAGSIMADLGAEVVHVEQPGIGDPARQIGPIGPGGHGLWWKVGGRNKRSVTIDLSHPSGVEIALRLVAESDVVVTNLRPSTLERWGLGYEDMRSAHPRIVVLQISAFGASGPMRDRPGFGKIGEAWSGAPHLTGFPDGPPTFSGFLLSDAATALMGVVAVEASLLRRERDTSFAGELVDIALFEPLFRMIDWQLPAADLAGPPVRKGNDSSIAETSLLDTFETADGEWVVVSCGTTTSLDAAAQLAGAPGTDDRSELKRAVAAWISARPADEALAGLDAVDVPASRILSAADILRHPVFEARGDVITVDDPDVGPVRMPAVLPHLRENPGRVWRPAPSLGQDNRLVLGDWLGLGDDKLAELAFQGVIDPLEPIT